MEIQIEKDSNNNIKKCRFCVSDIHKDATVCPVCQHNQSTWYTRLIRAGAVVAVLSLLPASLSTVVSYMNLNTAKEETEKATKALKTAELALRSATTAMERSSANEATVEVLDSKVKESRRLLKELETTSSNDPEIYADLLRAMERSLRKSRDSKLSEVEGSKEYKGDFFDVRCNNGKVQFKRKDSKSWTVASKGGLFYGDSTTCEKVLMLDGEIEGIGKQLVQLEK